MAKILLVEDDKTAAQFATTWLQAERHVVEVADTGLTAIEFLQMSDFDVILLDWDLPELSGYEVLRRLRALGKNTPVIMLTGKSAISDKEASLDGGADDYLTKPFELAELSARIRVQLRRSSNNLTNELTVGDIVLIPDQMKVSRNGVPVDLLPREFSLLEFFMRNPNKVFTSEAIMSRIWKLDADVGTSAFRTTLTRLRKKLGLGDNDNLIETVHGAGYRLNSSP